MSYQEYQDALEASTWTDCDANYGTEIWIIGVGPPGSIKEFAIHRNLLASASTYFDDLFISSFTETSSTNRLDLREDDPEVFSALVDWLYSGKTGTSYTYNHNSDLASQDQFWLKLYLMADYFDIIPLQAHAISSLVASLSPKFELSADFIHELFSANLSNKYLEMLIVADCADAIEYDPTGEDWASLMKCHDRFGAEVAIRMIHMRPGVSIASTGCVHCGDIVTEGNDGNVQASIGLRSAAARLTSRLKIFVKTMAGDVVCLRVGRACTTMCVKHHVRQVIGMPEDAQRLIFGGQQLVDGLPLSNYRLPYQATMHLVGRMRGCCLRLIDVSYTPLNVNLWGKASTKIGALPSDTVDRLKQLIEQHGGLPAAEQQLTAAKPSGTVTVLWDGSKTLLECGIDGITDISERVRTADGRVFATKD